MLAGVAESGLLIATHEALHGTLLALPRLKFAVGAGGLGLIFNTVEQAWKLRQTESRLARRLINDATGIALLHGVLLGIAVNQGCLLKYVLSWIVVERIILARFVKDNVPNTKERVQRPEPYKLYSREGRNDLMTILPTVDLLSIASKLLVKK